MHGFSPSSLASDAAYVWFRLGAERCSGKVFFRDEAQTSPTQCNPGSGSGNVYFFDGAHSH